MPPLVRHAPIPNELCLVQDGLDADLQQQRTTEREKQAARTEELQLRVVEAESRAEMAVGQLRGAQSEIMRLKRDNERLPVLEAQNEQLNQKIMELEARDSRIVHRIQDLERELEDGKLGAHPWQLFRNHVTNEETLSALTDRQVLRVLQSSFAALEIPITHLG